MAKFFEKFRRDVYGVLWGASALFIALSLFSYHPSDPSLNSFSKVASGVRVHNFCGYIGSFLSDFLFYIFGIIAWVFVFVLARASLRTFKEQTRRVGWISKIWVGSLLVVMSSLMALHFPETRFYNGQVPLGGALGLMVSHGLIAALNKIGVSIILWAAFLVFLVFYTEKSIQELVPWLWALGRRLIFEIKQLKFQMTRPREVSRPELQEIRIEKNDATETASPLKQPEEKKSILKFTLKDLTGGEPKKQKTKSPRPPVQIENWQLPGMELLLDPPGENKKFDEREINRNAKLVEQKLAEFDVSGQVVEVKPGPAVTMYEFKPAASVKINEITKLNDDLSLALSAESLRIIAPIPGRDVVGIETSNSTRQPIFMKDLLESQEFWSPDIKLPIALGKSVTGEAKIVDLRKLPHLLVAGTTGSGKSVFVMSLVTSLIMRHSPKTLKLILIDPKQVDLSAFHKIPHLLMPPVKETRPAINTLKWLVREMEKRYRSMSQFGSKNLEGFNEAATKMSVAEINAHEEKIRAFEAQPQTMSQSYYAKPLPYIVAVIEEFADLMSVDRVGVEPLVVRLAQMARAAGIHIVIAMQSPRREVLTGLIKTNFPGRISFKVASKVDSTIILDSRGAERLLSVGDMLYLAPGISQPQRYHGAFLKDEEITAVTEFWMKQGEPQFEQTAVKSMEASSDGSDAGDDSPEYDQEYDEVVAYVASQKEVSASLLQRRFRFGYPKAARLIEMLESEGVVGPSNGSKPRQVLANSLD